MIKTKDELINNIKEIFGEDVTSDACITLLDDVADTMDDFTSKQSDTTDWKQKYEDNDKEWRQKYTARFSEGGSSPEPEPEPESEPEPDDAPTHFNELFSKA